jgi:hypothetical protein
LDAFVGYFVDAVPQPDELHFVSALGVVQSKDLLDLARDVAEALLQSIDEGTFRRVERKRFEVIQVLRHVVEIVGDVPEQVDFLEK